MANPMPQPVANKVMRVGLGEALQRLLRVELRLVNGFATVEEEDLAQRQLILDALNLTQLDLGFDCDDDDVPDTVDIFERAAQTSCCRIVTEAPKPKKTKGKSRTSAGALSAPALEVIGVPPPVEAAPVPEPPKKGSRKSKGLLGTLFGNSDE